MACLLYIGAQLSLARGIGACVRGIYLRACALSRAIPAARGLLKNARAAVLGEFAPAKSRAPYSQLADITQRGRAGHICSPTPPAFGSISQLIHPGTSFRLPCRWNCHGGHARPWPRPEQSNSIQSKHCNCDRAINHLQVWPHAQLPNPVAPGYHRRRARIQGSGAPAPANHTSLQLARLRGQVAVALNFPDFGVVNWQI